MAREIIVAKVSDFSHHSEIFFFFSNCCPLRVAIYFDSLDDSKALGLGTYAPYAHPSQKNKDGKKAKQLNEFKANSNRRCLFSIPNLILSGRIFGEEVSHAI